MDDAAAWIERSRKLQQEKELAEKRVGEGKIWGGPPPHIVMGRENPKPPPLWGEKAKNADFSGIFGGGFEATWTLASILGILAKK